VVIYSASTCGEANGFWVRAGEDNGRGSVDGLRCRVLFQESESSVAKKKTGANGGEVATAHRPGRSKWEEYVGGLGEGGKKATWKIEERKRASEQGLEIGGKSRGRRRKKKRKKD